MRVNVWCLVFFTGFLACSGSEGIMREPYQLSDLTDSVIYNDLRFGITRNEFLKKLSEVPQQNIMSEPRLDTNVVEVEGMMKLDEYRFRVYYYFDIHDSLYEVKAEFRTEDSTEFKSASLYVAQMLYVPYGLPKKWDTLKNWYKFSWVLSNKQIILECGCFIQNCLVEVTTTEIRLFRKNRDRKKPVSSIN